MLCNLAGNEGSVNAFTAAIGKTIESASLQSDDALHVRFTDGSGIRFSDEGQSCCERRYMTTDDDLSQFAGAVFQGAELKEAPAIEAKYDEHDVQWLEVKTSKGCFTMASHNEHNGYYGGFAICVAALPAA